MSHPASLAEAVTASFVIATTALLALGPIGNAVLAAGDLARRAHAVAAVAHFDAAILAAAACPDTALAPESLVVGDERGVTVRGPGEPARFKGIRLESVSAKADPVPHVVVEVRTPHRDAGWRIVAPLGVEAQP